MSLFRNEMTKKIQEVHQQAVKSGWWVRDRNVFELYALIHSEVSEAVEEARRGTPPIYQKNGTEILQHPTFRLPHHEDWDPTKKPEGELVEMADVIIRIMDYCGQRGWDLGEAIEMKMAYNTTRSYRHGGKLA